MKQIASVAAAQLQANTIGWRVELRRANQQAQHLCAQAIGKADAIGGELYGPLEQSLRGWATNIEATVLAYGKSALTSSEQRLYTATCNQPSNTDWKQVAEFVSDHARMITELAPPANTTFVRPLPGQGRLFKGDGQGISNLRANQPATQPDTTERVLVQ